MALELVRTRARALSAAAAFALHAMFLALLFWLAPSAPERELASPSLIAVPLRQPEPPIIPPSPAEAGDAAPPSQGMADLPAAAIPSPPIVLVAPELRVASLDASEQASSGLGSAAGSGAGQDGAGSGNGAGEGGAGAGRGELTAPVRIAGALTHEDYRRVDPPRGSGGTVMVEFRVRPDGLVDRCRVLGSSGLALFDEATCRLVEERFRYSPARDASGRSIEWILRTDFSWIPR